MSADEMSFTRTITNELHSLESLMNGVTNFLEDRQVDAAAVYHINLALEEMITNIIKYGYNDYDAHNIQVSMEVGDAAVLTVIEDYGRVFNPLTQMKAPAEGQVGGLGIHLLKQLLDSMEYRREGERNILQIRTLRTPPAGA